MALYRICAKLREQRRRIWSGYTGFRRAVKRSIGGPVCLSMMAACPALLHAQSWSGAVALSSQLVDRGLAITPVTPTVQGSISRTTATGWSFSAAGSAEVRAPGESSEVLVQGAHYWMLSSNWQMQASLLYYDYPGNSRAGAFNRAETSVDWIYRDLLTFGLSASYLTGNGQDHQPHGALDVNLHWPLAPHLAASAGIGAAQSFMGSYGYDLSQYSPGRGRLYGYGQVGLIWTNAHWRVELDRVVVDPGMRRQWGNLAAAPWVATLSRSF